MATMVSEARLNDNNISEPCVTTQQSSQPWGLSTKAGLADFTKPSRLPSLLRDCWQHTD